MLRPNDYHFFESTLKISKKSKEGATSLIDSYKNLTYSDILVSFNLPSLEYRRIVNDMMEIYRHLQTYDPATVLSKLITRPNRKLSNHPEFSD